MHAAGIEGAEGARKQVEAIRMHRQLLDATDPVPALRATLTDLLRQALNNAHEAHEKAYAAGQGQLVGNDTWQKLTQPQQQRILGDVDLTAPVKPDTSTDIAILAALDSRNLSARKAEADAVAGRLANVLKAAAILLEPKVRPVIVDKALLKTAEEVRLWTARQEKMLLAAIETGPVQVQ
jgi:hypothetical protein